MSTLSLKGKCAVVTGGAGGLGFEIARRLLDAGASVAIWDRNESRVATIEAELGPLGNVHFVYCDQADSESVDRAFNTTLGLFPCVDILVNNAGIIGPSANLWEYPVADWRQIMDINLNGFFYCCRALVPHMLERKKGRIVNMASIAGKEGNPKLSGYSVAKAGVIALTKSLGKELATSGILVNAVAPAVIASPMNKEVPAELTAGLIAKIPMGRAGAPEEVAAMVHWLCTEEVSFSTGAIFDLSGGRASY